MTTIKAQVEVGAQNLAYMNSIVRTDLQSLCARSKALLSYINLPRRTFRI